MKDAAPRWLIKALETLPYIARRKNFHPWRFECCPGSDKRGQEDACTTPTADLRKLPRHPDLIKVAGRIDTSGIPLELVPVLTD